MVIPGKRERPCRKSDPTTLFRQEALASSERQNDGQVIIIRPVSFTVLTAGVGVFLARSALFVLCRVYAGELARACAFLQGSLPKCIPSSRVITQVFVAEGDLVQQGNPLFTLEANLYNGTGENTTEFMKRELERGITLHRESMERERAGQRIEY